MTLRAWPLGLLLGLYGASWAQETRAIISGTVTDPQGAVVARAQIEIKNLETNVVTKVETNESGRYTSPPVNPGQYMVTVSAPGFRTAVRSNIELRVADRMLLDFQLELGATTETVTVTAEAPLVETGTASQSTTINRELVATLPTYARDVFELVRYTAGVQGGTRGMWGQRPFDAGDNSVRILGGAANTNEVLLDGSPNTYRETTAVAQTTSPPPDAVAEVKIQTNVYDAEYGRTGGGVITVNLKSGTNDYHGVLGWYLRNDVLNANTFESNAVGGAKTSFRMHQPVAQFQGPVRLPRLYDGRDRTFFMYAIDIYRNARPQPSSMVVPTALERQGDFSRTFVSGTSGPTVAIYDPLTTTPSGSRYTRTPFPGNKLPPSRINPIAAKIMELVLEPDRVAPRGQPNLLITPNYDHEPFNSHVFRLDHVLTGEHRLFVTTRYNNRHQTNGVGLGLSAYQARGTPYVSTSYKHWRVDHSATFNLTSVISPTVVSTARASWNRHEFAIDLYGFGFDPTTLGFPPALLAQAQSKSFPAISIGGYSELGPTRSGGNVLNFSDTWSLGETLSKVVGEHALRFGGEARLMLNNQSSRMPTLSITTNAGFTRADPLVASATSGDGLASFLLGYPSALTSEYTNFPAQGQRYYGVFFQDDWRITRRLTLNLGARWEYESPITDRYDRFVRGFDFTTVTTLGSPDGPQIRGGLLFADRNHRLPYKRDLNNISPRTGYAYQVSSKLVLRGGWAITYDPTAVIAPATGFSATTSPSTSVANAGLVPVTLPGCSGPSCGMLSNPFPDGILRPPGRSKGLQTNVGQSISFVWPERTVPYSHTFSAGIAYQLPLRSVLEISYSGRRARQLPTSRNLNSVTYEQYLTHGADLTGVTVPNPYAGLLPGTSLNGAKMTLQQSLLPYPQFLGITETHRSIGTARYDFLLVKFEKRLSAGFTTLFTATFGWGTTYSTYLHSGMDAIGQFIRRDAGVEPYIINWIGAYSIPFFSHSRGLIKALVAGWNLAGFAQWRAGSLLTVSGASSTGLDPTLPKKERSYKRWFNTCTYNMNTGKRQNCASETEPVAWIIQKPFTLLLQPEPEWRNLRAPVPLSVDLSLYKTFKAEHFSVDVRADANNAFNTPRFDGPNMNANSSLFGVTTLAQANMPRSVQLSLRLSF